MEEKPYDATVGYLNFAQTCTCLYLSFVTRCLVQYQSDCSLMHLQVANEVLTYVQETKDLLLTYR